jgi:hypothetical protein
MVDLLLHHARNRVDTESIRPCSPEGGVEVGAHGPSRPGARQGVAGSAFLDEQALPFTRFSPRSTSSQPLKASAAAATPPNSSTPIE